jgi:hypothetical protein
MAFGMILHSSTMRARSRLTRRRASPPAANTVLVGDLLPVVAVEHVCLLVLCDRHEDAEPVDRRLERRHGVQVQRVEQLRSRVGGDLVGHDQKIAGPGWVSRPQHRPVREPEHSNEIRRG